MGRSLISASMGQESTGAEKAGPFAGAWFASTGWWQWELTAGAEGSTQANAQASVKVEARQKTSIKLRSRANRMPLSYAFRG